MKHVQFSSIQKGPLDTNPYQQGISIVEVVLAAALFGMLLTAFVGALIYGQESVAISGARMRAVALATEGLEATRNIRDEQWNNLSDGTYGLALLNNQWVFSGTSSTVDQFTRQIIISSAQSSIKNIESKVTWQQTAQRSGQVSLTSYLSDWRETTATQGELLTIDISLASLSGDNKELRNIKLKNLGSSSITMTDIRVSWTDSTRKIERVRFGQDTVWSKTGPGTPIGVQPSGTLLNMVDWTLQAGAEQDIDNIKFTHQMSGDTIAIEFTMEDGTTRSVTKAF